MYCAIIETISLPQKIISPARVPNCLSIVEQTIPFVCNSVLIALFNIKPIESLPKSFPVFLPLKTR